MARSDGFAFATNAGIFTNSVNLQDELVAYVKGGEIHLLTREQAMKKVQDWFCSIVPRGLSLADELIQERRAEAAREEREFYRK